MSGADEKQTLHRYLRNARGVLLWKLEGLSDYDIRRPMTPTGTNLLGLVKHSTTTSWKASPGPKLRPARTLANEPYRPDLSTLVTATSLFPRRSFRAIL
jgi:Protein of unknown function (DUF664)